MRLLPMLSRPRPTPPARTRTHRRTESLPPEERPGSCGWYDSSHELQTGLRVTEHADVGAVVNLVPVSWWLAWELDAAMSSVTSHRP